MKKGEQPWLSLEELEARQKQLEIFKRQVLK